MTREDRLKPMEPPNQPMEPTGLRPAAHRQP